MEARQRPLTAHLWKMAVALGVVFAAMRVVGVLGPGGLRWLLPLGFTLMALTPYLLLDAPRRRELGLRLPTTARAYPVAIVAGIASALACFTLGYVLFGAGVDNWFVTIANSYRQVLDTTGWTVARLHLFFTIPALLFSPFGEEIFFRGFLQYALEQRFSARASTMAECAAFGVVHVCHHGLLLAAGGIAFLPVSGPLWMLLMFGVALVFAYLRKASGSLLPAIAAHVCFNLTMNVTIFRYLWAH
jgi:uncharacterized protein